MDQEKVKRGIDFSNRLGEGKFSDTYRKSLAWWRGGKLNKKTLGYILIVFTLNFIIISPFIGRDVSGAFVSSSAFMLLAKIFETIFFIKQDFFFSFITIFSLSLAPISFFLFMRKIALRHELTAFIATLLFILPNPFFEYTPSLGAAILYGDGAHEVMFAFIPIFLLYVESFISTGIPVLGFLTAIGTGIIAIFSPFMMFNLLIIYPILAIAEGFLGNLRIKLLRMFFLFAAAFGLSLFWYFPTFFSRGILLSHVVYAIDKSVSLFPLLIPIIPVFGALFFLVFDRRKRLKPIFVGLSLLIIYLLMFRASKDIMMGGIFTPERYRLELTFAGSITLSIIFVILGESMVRELIRHKKQSAIFFLGSILLITCIIVVFAMVITSLHASRIFIASEPMRVSSGEGVGSLTRIFRFSDIPSLLMDSISVGTFIILLNILKTYPSLHSKTKINTP